VAVAQTADQVKAIGKIVVDFAEQRLGPVVLSAHDGDGKRIQNVQRGPPAPTLDVIPTNDKVDRTAQL